MIYTPIKDRIATRAYFMFLNHEGTSDVDRWDAAEMIENDLAKQDETPSTVPPSPDDKKPSVVGEIIEEIITIFEPEKKKKRKAKKLVNRSEA